jgi:hypothetical protein
MEKNPSNNKLAVNITTMTIQPNPHKDDYKLFPYRLDLTDGRTNNGGIDLVRELYRIDQISEHEGFPELRQFLIKVNGENSLFMTLGCEANKSEDGNAFSN